MPEIPILIANEDRQVERKSSIAQHRSTFSVVKKGEWIPISFDVLDYIDCDTARSHKAIVTDDPNTIGYNFPVAECKYYTDEYVFYNHRNKELRQLPHWFGEGFGEVFIDSLAFLNSDTNSLGVRNEYRLRTGLDYYLAKENLPAV